MKQLCIPESLLDQHMVVLGKTRSGKSSVLRHIVEHLLTKKKRVCIIDPKGDWWGLKSSDDGKKPGFPVVAFGDFKEQRASDVPITAESAKEIARLITEGNRPCIIGMRGWMPSQLVKFWIAFASNLFNCVDNEFFLVCDEFHNFAPKGKIMDPESGRCLHWSNRLASEGLGLGLHLLIASQRPQKVHNDTLTCCETLVAMRVIHAADRSAVRDWIDGCGDGNHGIVLESLAQMERGEAWVWSPESKFGPVQIKFPMFTTFDSFAEPRQRRVKSPSTWAEVDLEEVKQKLAKEIEQSKANDPAELRREVERMKTELKQASRAPMVAPVKTVEKVVQFVPKELRREIVRLNITAGRFAEQVKRLEKSMLDWEQKQSENKGAPLVYEEVKTFPDVVRTPYAQKVSDRQSQRILDTIAMLSFRGFTPNREMIARWMGIHPNGGRFNTQLADLRQQGLIDKCQLTEQGQGKANLGETGWTGFLECLDGSRRAIVSLLFPRNTYSREELALKLGIHPNGGRYNTNLALLRAMGVIPERGPIVLAPQVFK